MLGEGLTTRYEFGPVKVEDGFGHRLSGNRIDDNAAVNLVVFDPAVGVGHAEAAGVLETVGRLADLKLAPVLLCLEAGRTEDENSYMVFEAPGLPSLKSVIKEKGGLSPAEALGVVWALAAVLRETSRIGCHHLDISSSSIYYGQMAGGAAQIRIDGFGLSTVLPAYSPIKKNSLYFGTAEYMAPEVCSGRPGNGSADLYALGILMYEMVAGKPPFVSSNPSTTIKRQVYEKPLPLHLVKPGLGQLDAYEGLVTKLLAKDPSGRPQSAADVMAAVEKLKVEVFPEVSLVIEDARDTVPVPVSMFDEDKVSAKPEPEASSNETMAIEGLSDAVAEMMRKQEESAAAEVVAEPERARPAVDSESGVKTEAFDASFIAAAVEKAAAGAEIGAAVEEARAEAAKVVEPVRESKQEKAAKKARKTKEVKAAKAESPFSDTDHGFGSDEAAEEDSVFPSDDAESKKSGKQRLSFIIVIAVIALLGIAFAVWWEIGPPPSPVQAPAAVEKVEVKAAPPAVSPAREAALDKVRLGRMMFGDGDLSGAMAATAEALKIEPGCPEARKLEADVLVMQEKLKAEAEAKAAAEAPEQAQAAADEATTAQPAPEPVKADVPVVVKEAKPGRIIVDTPEPTPEPVKKPKKADRNKAAVPEVETPAPAPEPVPQPETTEPVKIDKPKKGDKGKKADKLQKVEDAEPAPELKKVEPEPKKVEPEAKKAEPEAAKDPAAEAIALIKKGQAADKAGDYNAAIAYFEKAGKLNPDNKLVGKLIEKSRAKLAEPAN